MHTLEVFSVFVVGGFGVRAGWEAAGILGCTCDHALKYFFK